MRITSGAGLCLALLGVSLLLSPPAQADTCPAGQHWNDWGDGSGFCSPDASGGGTGGNVSIDLGGGGGGSYGDVGPAPVYNAPPPPAYAPAPAVPAAPLPAAQAPVPAPVQVQVPSGGQAATTVGQIPGAGRVITDAQNLPQVAPGDPGDTAPAAGVDVVPAAEPPAEMPNPGGSEAAPSETPIAQETAATAAGPGSAEVPAAQPKETVKGAPVSEVETAAGGFIGAVLAALVAAGGILYWRKGRGVPADTTGQ